MGEFAPRIQAVAKAIRDELQGSSERHNGQLFPSTIIKEPQTVTWSEITDIELEEGPFGERARWSSARGALHMNRSVVINSTDGTLSVYEELLGEDGNITGRWNYPVADTPEALIRPYYSIARSQRTHVPTVDKEIVVSELETAVAALTARRTQAA